MRDVSRSDLFRALVGLLALAGSGCQSDAARLTAERPLHLEDHLGAAAIEGSELPADVPSPIEWRLDEPQPEWKPLSPLRRNIEPVHVARTEDGLRLTLTESNRYSDELHGGIYVDLPGLNGEDWGHILVRARTSDEVDHIEVGFNLRSEPGSGPDQEWPIDQQYPMLYGGEGVPVIHDGLAHTYELHPEWPWDGWDGPWRQLSIQVGAPDSASIDILSVRILPKELPFADSAVGVRTVGETHLRSLYIRAPGRVEYPIDVPDAGRLDLSLGVLRNDAPVTFRVSATPEGDQTEKLLEEVWADRERWRSHSLDLSRLAGRPVTLTLEAEADRTGTVALFRAPTLYTPSSLSATIVDGATGEPTPVRVRLTDAEGAIAPLPEAAIGVMYGYEDQPFGYHFQGDSSFYVDGAFDVRLQPGTYRLSLSKGNEYERQEHELRLESGDQLSRTFRLGRWIDMPERGWFSADDHIHVKRSPRDNPFILTWIAAEDVHVGALLQMGDFWTTYFAQYAWGRDGVYQVEDYFITSGQEDPRTHEVGHTISLGADEFVRVRFQEPYPIHEHAGETASSSVGIRGVWGARVPGYYYYDRVFDRVHELGGLTGYAHKATSFHGYRGLTLDVLRKKVDFLEILQFGHMELEHYYHFLDLGFKLTATAGSDFPYGVESYGVRIGAERFYTYVGGEFDFDSWLAGLRAGHTFVTNGPILDLKVNGKIPGEELEVPAGSRLTITAQTSGHERQVPLERLEIVSHGQVLKSATVDEPGQSTEHLTVEMELPVEHGLWIAARTSEQAEQPRGRNHIHPGLAHTTPVYVTVDGSGFHNPETALHFLNLSEAYLQELEQEIARPNQSLNEHAWRFREGLEARIAETREVIANLRAEFGRDSSP